MALAINDSLTMNDIFLLGLSLAWIGISVSGYLTFPGMFRCFFIPIH